MNVTPLSDSDLTKSAPSCLGFSFSFSGSLRAEVHEDLPDSGVPGALEGEEEKKELELVRTERATEEEEDGMDAGGERGEMGEEGVREMVGEEGLPEVVGEAWGE